MAIFVCDQCGCRENTACSLYWCRPKGSPALCSECDPEIGRWRGRVPKRKWDSNPEGICNRDPKEFGYCFK